MTGDCCVFKSLRRRVDGKHLMRFQSETFVSNFSVVVSTEPAMYVFIHGLFPKHPISQSNIVKICSFLACLQAVTGDFIAENPFRLLIGRHLGFLRRALPGTSGRAQKRRLFVNYRSPRSSASRIIQNGGHKANSGFSRRRKTPTPTGRLVHSR